MGVKMIDWLMGVKWGDTINGSHFRFEKSVVVLTSGKGNALNVQGNYEEAIKCYDKAIELDPNYTFAWSGKGNALSNLGKFEEAIICYDKSLAIDPNNKYALDNKDLALKKLGNGTW